MLKKIVFYTRLGYKFIKKDIINKDDYRDEYNKVSETYANWLNEMGQFTDKIINFEYMPKDKTLKILDFACGTGYISKSILKKDINCEITAVDYSDKMLEKLKNLKDNRLKVVHCDGIEFLKNTEEKYDIIYFGWGLSYFNHRKLFKLFTKVLNDGGIVGIITNVQGTLSDIEDIFMKVMYRNCKEVIKPMDIRFNLPNGKKGLTKWFTQYGFEKIEVEDGEVLVTFDEPEQLLRWLNETGAAAGTACIFKDYDLIKDDLIEEIKKVRYKKDRYEINHRFAYGIFKLR